MNYYAKGADEPTAGGTNFAMEDALRPATEKFAGALRSKFDAANLTQALKTYKSDLITIFKNLK